LHFTSPLVVIKLLKFVSKLYGFLSKIDLYLENFIVSKTRNS
jgi:hypothetical protein